MKNQTKFLAPDFVFGFLAGSIITSTIWALSVL